MDSVICNGDGQDLITTNSNALTGTYLYTLFLDNTPVTTPVNYSSVTSPAFSNGTDLGDNWCKDVRIHFFAGGAEGDGFAGIVQAGAENAIRDKEKSYLKPTIVYL